MEEVKGVVSEVDSVLGGGAGGTIPPDLDSRFRVVIKNKLWEVLDKTRSGAVTYDDKPKRELSILIDMYGTLCEIERLVKKSGG